jgi:hypothetical protein
MLSAPRLRSSPFVLFFSGFPPFFFFLFLSLFFSLIRPRERLGGEPKGQALICGPHVALKAIGTAQGRGIATVKHLLALTKALQISMKFEKKGRWW